MAVPMTVWVVAPVAVPPSAVLLVAVPLRTEGHQLIGGARKSCRRRAGLLACQKVARSKTWWSDWAGRVAVGAGVEAALEAALEAAPAAVALTVVGAAATAAAAGGAAVGTALALPQRHWMRCARYSTAPACVPCGILRMRPPWLCDPPLGCTRGPASLTSSMARAMASRVPLRSGFATLALRLSLSLMATGLGRRTERLAAGSPRRPRWI